LGAKGTLMMSLFQNSVLRQHFKGYDRRKALEAYAVYCSEFLPKIANIKPPKRSSTSTVSLMIFLSRCYRA